MNSNQKPQSIISPSLFTPLSFFTPPSLHKSIPHFSFLSSQIHPQTLAESSAAIPTPHRSQTMDVAPPVEKRQLRQRKPPPAAASPPPEDLDSDEEIRGKSKRRKTASRSVKKQSKVVEVEPELTQTGGKGKVAASAKTNPKASAKSAKANGQAGEKNNNGKKIKSKKQSRSVVKGDVGGVEMEEEDEEEEGLNEEEEEDAQEAAAVTTVPEKKVRVAQSSRDAPDAVLVGDPIDDVVARKKWPHRYRRKVYFLLLLIFFCCFITVQLKSIIVQ